MNEQEYPNIQTIFRVEKSKENPFVMIDRRPLEKPYMSWKAKGLLAYLLSRPDNWVINFGDLVKRSTDGEYATRAAAKELEKAGHLKVDKERDDTGKIVKWVYTVYEQPLWGFQDVGNQDVGNQDVGNRDINDTESNDTELTDIGANAPDTLPVDWQILAGSKDIHLQDQKQAKMQDAANLMDMGCPGAYALAYAFMQARDIIIPTSKVKGQRKAAREMLEMNVRAEHITEATKSLLEKGMTVTDLFSVSKTAINLANPTPESNGYNPQGLSVQ